MPIALSRRAPACALALALAIVRANAQTTIAAGQTQPITTSNASSLGTITFNGGTLQNGTAGGNYSNLLDIAPNYNGTIDANGLSGTLSGVISGGGNLLTLTNSGGGTPLLSLTGANTYTAVTAINSVTVGVGNASAFGGSGGGSLSLTGATLQMQTAATVANNALLVGNSNAIDIAGFNSVFSGTFFGTGGMNLQNSGAAAELDLTGTSYYSGPTTVASGLTLGLANSGLGTGAVTLGSGDTLKFVGAASLPNAITFSGPLTLDAYGSAATLSGTLIGGVNAVTVQDTNGGAGVITLSGSGNAWTGGTTINSGTLALGAAQGLPTGSALTINGGTFDMSGYAQSLASVSFGGAGTLKTGAAQLSVSGNYSAASGSSLGVYPIFTSPNLSVNGTASLTGQTLFIEQRPASGDYTIVDAAAGLGGTTFTGTSCPAGTSLSGGLCIPSGYKDSLSYVGNEVLLKLTAPSLVLPSQTANEASIASGLNAANGASSTDLATTLGQLNSLSVSNPAQLNAELDQIGPIAYAALGGLALAGAGVQAQAVARRAAALEAGNGGGYAQDGSPYPGPLVADAGGGPVPALLPAYSPLDTPWGFFGSMLYASGRLDGINGASGFQPGYSFSALGGTAGVDYRFTDGFAMGLTGGYTVGSAMLGDGLGTASNDSLRLGTYMAIWDGAFHETTYLGTALDSFVVNRNIVAMGRTATSSPNGQELNLDSEAGYDVKRGRTVLTPTAGLDYDRLSVAGFGENGAGAMDLNVAPADFNSLRSTLGAKISRRFGDWFTVTPSASAAWQHEFADQSRALSAQFADGGGGAFSVNTADVSREALLAALNVDVGFGETVTAHLGASEDLRSDFLDRTVDASVKVRF